MAGLGLGRKVCSRLAQGITVTLFLARVRTPSSLCVALFPGRQHTGFIAYAPGQQVPLFHVDLKWPARQLSERSDFFFLKRQVLPHRPGLTTSGAVPAHCPPPGSTIPPRRPPGAGTTAAPPHQAGVVFLARARFLYLAGCEACT